VTLPVGERLGNYQVIALLGAGGMGEVYRASDSKLGRVVALKVLPSGLHMEDEQRMARFQREAQILAALNHPNIATIHGLEDSGPTHALVMELVEGPTLADRIAEGPLPLEEALSIAAQIAEALEYAHERGIIHRDLKPANVKITPDGKVKVLDFGLAKALEDSPETVNISTSPTLTMGATRAGIILGTAAYMPPEQAKGKSVDRRGDVWAFGVVLFEMLTGKQLYTGETASEVLAAVIMNEPDVNSLPSNTPAPIRLLIRRCITRDPRQRLRDIGEARISINEYLANPAAATAAANASSSATIAASQQSPAARALPWTIAALTTALAIIAAWAPWRASPEPIHPTRLSVEIGANASLVALGIGPITTISPDGTKFAFVAVSDSDKKARLYVRQRDNLEATPLAGTENAHDPFFSPDGESIAFFSDAKLKRISVLGGAVVTLCDAPSDRGGAWSEDGTIIFARSNREGLSRISDSGGTPELLTKLDSSKGEITHRWPQILPGGKTVLFTAHNSGTNFFEGSIYVQDIKSGERKLLHASAMFGRYVPSGHLIFANDGTIFAVPFDLDRLQATGSPTPFLEHVAMSTSTGSAQFDVSRTGTLIYFAGNSSGEIANIDWMDKDGNFQPLHLTPADYRDPSISPDGKKLALILRDRKASDVWVYDLERDTLSRVTFNGYNISPVWTPDGRHIVYSSAQDSSQANLYWVNSDGTGTPQRLTQDKSQQLAYSVSKDGKLLAFEQLDYSSKTGRDIWTLSLEGSDKQGWKPPQPQVFLNSPFFESSPAFSQDARWLAYSSDDTGANEIYVRAFPGPGGKYQVSNGGGVDPIWSKDGKQLLYRTLREPYKMMIANFRIVNGAFQNDKPQEWSPGTIENRGYTTWSSDLSPDGKRFVVLKAPEVAANSAVKNDKFVLILNAFDDLRRKTSAAKP
jgi:Tol biopolymer transport system component